MTTLRSRTAGALAAALAMAALLGGCAPGESPSPSAAPGDSSTAPPSPDPRAAAAIEALHELEGRYGATLGVYALDTGTGRAVEFRADERFAYASTSKALLAGAVLASVDTAALDQTVRYTADDLVAHSPVTEANVSDGLTLRAIIAAALRQSDNTAANLLFRQLGGPDGLQDALRALGDGTTQVARIEPDLNQAAPDDTRDTSTPRALASDLRSYAIDDALTPDRRSLLVEDLTDNETGATLIRAGVPDGWSVADKSGAASYGTRNDIAVVRPPGRAPIVLAVLSHKQTRDAAYDDALIADAARVVATALG